MSENEMNTTEFDAMAESGTDMALGGGLGGIIGGFVGNKLGYAKALRDVSKATGTPVEDLRKEIKEANPEKPKRGKLKFRNPFYRDPAEDPEPDVTEKEDKAPQKPKRTTKRKSK